MANLKISELTAAGALTGAELVELVQGGVNKQSTTQDIANLGGGGGTWGSITGTLSSQTDLQSALDAKAATTEVIGIQDIWISAEAMAPRITDGCAELFQIEQATSFVNLHVLAFDQTVQEYAQFRAVLPRKWNGGTVTMVPYWTAQAGAGTVRWTLSGGAYSNDDALTVALGTAQNSDDTLIALNDLHIGPESSAITLAGSPADADYLVFQISRDTANDTLSGDALLLGISLRITTDAAKDA